ncbi:response regulator [Marivirga arenosa]|uniref:Response regulator n=1 Tax=Marivirga arenosa TaxID=3059076 RepID=A0AA49GEJ8_9BACT|nr:MULTISPECIES: response regulator [unclassified Marivirga]WKK80565.2 response regulator [Marivirga sp. BKB1-2]WKK84448.1 response regulator [Marivirga sp. ABR2-2]
MATFKNICIVDDDDMFIRVSKFIMKDENFAENIYHYYDGREAIEHLIATQPSELPEILLVDINMPMMDGWEFMDELEKIRKDDKMKIYITSSSIDPADLKKAEGNPFVSGFISKPIEPEALKKIIDGYK